MSVLKGLDVSYSNGNINWTKVKATNKVDFAILRCGFGSKSEEQVDNQYYNNAKGCIANNIPFGIYHFAYCVSVEDAEREADFAIELANKYKNYVQFIAYDIEEDTLRYCKQQGVTHTRSSLTSCANAFLKKVKNAGYIPVLYTNYDYIYNKYNYSELSDYYLWLAYPEASSAGRECSIWQYSWIGKVDGISGDVDMDYLYDTSLISKTSTTTDTKSVTQFVKITAKDGLNVRKGAGTSYNVIGAIPYNETVSISKISGNWGFSPIYQGWICLDYTQSIKPKIYYQAYTNGRWLAWVDGDSDYAGIRGKSIQGLRIKTSFGDVKYRVKTVGGSWLPYVYGSNSSEYAGILGKYIDCVQVQIVGLENTSVNYRVENTNSSNYLSWVTDVDKSSGDGYAGIIGKPIDKFQAKLN